MAGVFFGPARVRPTISATELHEQDATRDLTIVDARPLPAYNGWRLGAEGRGGHIPAAAAFPAAWLTSVDLEEVVRLLQGKSIVPSRPVVIYGDDTTSPDVAALGARLEELGHDGVRVLEGGFAAWAADETRPVDRLANHDRLVHPEWLRRELAGEPQEASPARGFLLFHVNSGVPEEYAENHLPGAIYLDTNRLEDPADWNRREPDELDEALRGLGIRHDTAVVLYGRDSAGDANEKWPARRAGQIAATRAAAILRYAGVDDVRILDGGYDAWVAAGNPIETVEHHPSPVPSFGLPIPQRPELIVDIAEAKAVLADPEGAALVSVRTWKEHVGKLSGYDFIGPAGRIAGDVWGNCGSDAYHMQHYRNVDNTMRAYPEIAANWAAGGITRDKWVAFYCGTGWRASETWFYAWLMGWDRIAVYDGGWFEWSADPANNPIEVSEPADADVAVP